MKEPAVADQVTPAWLTSLASIAVKFSDCPTVRPPRAGVRPTLRLLLEIVMVADAERVVSLTEVAVMVTAGIAGMLAGAVYVTAPPDALELAERLPHIAPLQLVPESDQAIPLFCESLLTVAVRACV